MERSTQQIQNLKNERAENEAKIEQLTHQNERLKARELTAELLNTLIEKIVIHEAVKDKNKVRQQKIDIYYRFVGKIE